MAACHLHLQGQKQLAKPLQTMYIQTPDPYGSLERHLKQTLKTSNVVLVASPEQASTILNVTQDHHSSHLLSVSGTQQTRQYSLVVTVSFTVTDKLGHDLVPTQTLKESRVITEQSNLILGSSNEANLFIEQMRRSLAQAIMNRLASKQITRLLLEQKKVSHP